MRENRLISIGASPGPANNFITMPRFRGCTPRPSATYLKDINEVLVHNPTRYCVDGEQAVLHVYGSRTKNAANEALRRRYGNWRGEMERRGASAS